MSNSFTYKTKGTCSKLIELVIDDQDIIESLVVTGGCNGNLKGISSIVKGKHIDEVISAFKDITCGPRSTSCPDQIACALNEYKASKQH
ncbi:MAG: TIGR03905 family TSCPD domain-containing protein [Erysipelotrichaceae bacterium]|nr:TIGR03905 family TSCPD domain-containing protein [Erysipelotrichaceae bacterium]MDY5252337.1 TIGR03905 family TSCPD domain-containing protein [Erysipelotrichaceae bacterium]